MGKTRALAGAILLVALSPAQAVQYELVDLRALPMANGGKAWLTPRNLNNRGEVAGQVLLLGDTGGRSRAARMAGDRIEILPTLPGSASATFSVAAINDAGDIVGYAESKGSAARPVLWITGGPPQLLSGDIADRSAGVKAINASGDMAGTFMGGARAFAMLQGALHAIEPLGTNAKGHSYTRGERINNRGQVIGVSSSADGDLGFLWNNGQTRALQPLPQHLGPTGGSTAHALNDHSQVVGCSWKANAGSVLPVLWGPEGTARVIFEPDAVKKGAHSACAKGINNHGVVVGEIFTPGGRTAFTWDAKLGFRDLEELADPSSRNWKRFLSADAINDRGEMIGIATGTKSTDVQVPFLLRICEGWYCMLPGRKTSLALGAGLLVILAGIAGWVAWRRGLALLPTGQSRSS